jgi:hypothetical protein
MLTDIDYTAYRVLQYEGPSGTFCAPRSRFYLSESGIEEPDADCLLVIHPIEEYVDFYYDSGFYRARVGEPFFSLRAYARKYLGKFDLLLCDISSL